MSEDLLVLAVDRDDDVGRKTDFEGPVVGKEKNLELAQVLGLSDPEDSDTNTILQAVKIYEEKENSEVATITGNSHVGVESDEILNEQLQKVLKETNREKVVLVVDGTEDEQILPIVQNHAEIVSVKRVIMKQSERLEGMYYQINEFFKEVLSDPKMGKIFFGIPAIFLIFYSLLGVRGWRITLGILGAYLLIRGFHLEEPLERIYNELQTSFTARRVTFFFYVVSLAIAAIAINSGYNSVQMEPTADIIESSAAFLQGSVYLFFTAFLVSMVGKSVIAFPDRSSILRHSTYIAFFLGFALVASEASRVILNPGSGLARFGISIATGLAFISVTLTLEKIFQ
ncbi:MAG: DUF373 family protein [Candidatus Aenigmatarchaeota archaeon]